MPQFELFGRQWMIGYLTTKLWRWIIWWNKLRQCLGIGVWVEWKLLLVYTMICVGTQKSVLLGNFGLWEVSVEAVAVFRYVRSVNCGCALRFTAVLGLLP